MNGNRWKKGVYLKIYSRSVHYDNTGCGVFKNHRNLFWFFFSLKNMKLGAHFLLWHFLITSIFKSLYFLKWCQLLTARHLLQFSKFNNFLWVSWFLCKNLSYLVSLVLKLHNWKCHTVQKIEKQQKTKSKLWNFFMHPIFP